MKQLFYSSYLFIMLFLLACNSGSPTESTSEETTLESTEMEEIAQDTTSTVSANSVSDEKLALIKDFLDKNPQVTESDIKVVEGETTVNESNLLIPIPESQHTNKQKSTSNKGVNNNCGLVYERDSGDFSVWKATYATCIIVDNVRNGRIVSSGRYHVPVGGLWHFKINNGNGNYDGFRCCI
jgi:hypothetical protein